VSVETCDEEMVQMSLSEPLNNQTRLNFLRSNKRPLKMRRLIMQEGLTSRMALVTRWEISTTQGRTTMIKNSLSSAKAALTK
jgi:hypothetical protein